MKLLVWCREILTWKQLSDFVRFSNKNGLAVPCCQTHKYCSMLCQFLAVYKLYQGTRTLHKRNSLKQNKQTQSQMKTTITSLNPTVTFQESARTMQVDLVERVFQKTMLIRGIQTPRTTMGWVLYHPIGKRLTPTKANRISSIITQVFWFFLYKSTSIYYAHFVILRLIKLCPPTRPNFLYQIVIQTTPICHSKLRRIFKIIISDNPDLLFIIFLPCLPFPCKEHAVLMPKFPRRTQTVKLKVKLMC